MLAATATATPTTLADSCREFRLYMPLHYHLSSMHLVKVGIECLFPTDLPRLLAAEKLLLRHHYGLAIHVEETGEHILLGPCEWRLDLALQELREADSPSLEIKVSELAVTLREAITANSIAKCLGRSPNGRNYFEVMAHPLPNSFVVDHLEKPPRPLLHNPAMESLLAGLPHSEEFAFGSLGTGRFWAFGPESLHGTNILSVDHAIEALGAPVHSSIVAGFHWATRTGPLCEEPLRGTRLHLLHGALDAEPVHRGSGQLVPAMRRASHAAIVLANPVLLEPVYRGQIIVSSSFINRVKKIISQRRARVLGITNIMGSPLSLIDVTVPVLDSFGLDTDLRLSTQGQAVLVLNFDSFQLVPGNPLDASLVLPPLRPAPDSHLARDLLVKTRNRKGLDPSWSVSSFLDPAQVISLHQLPAEPLPPAAATSGALFSETTPLHGSHLHSS
jgi:U5 small nuclear ribonucleoprotein component